MINGLEEIHAQASDTPSTLPLSYRCGLGNSLLKLKKAKLLASTSDNNSNDLSTRLFHFLLSSSVTKRIRR
jgi:hypothetical protein